MGRVQHVTSGTTANFVSQLRCYTPSRVPGVIPIQSTSTEVERENEVH